MQQPPLDDKEYWELYAQMYPCVGCGHCCKSGSCAFGEWDELADQCKFLVLAEDGSRYNCARYDEIKDDPTAVIAPAFGAGCCQPIGNERRRVLMAEGRLMK